MRQARSAAGAVILPDNGLMPAAEFMAFLNARREDQMQVGRVYITVGNDRAIRQNGKGGGQTGFARSSLTADDDKFLHSLMSPRQTVTSLSDSQTIS